VVVMGDGKKKTFTAPKMQVRVDSLEPEHGWANFDDYIASNIQTPDELRNKPEIQKGEVELSFEVNKEGQAVNITVTRSLCEKCDEEAVRLLKEGPKWKKKKNRKGKVTIKF
jgi:2-keto-4-pentenoate hydratase